MAVDNPSERQVGASKRSRPGDALARRTCTSGKRLSARRIPATEESVAPIRFKSRDTGSSRHFKALSDNTRRAYQSDLAHFDAWGGQLQADPAIVASYLAAHSDTLSVAKLVRRMATISKAHEAKGLPNPCRSEIVRATLRGIKRTRGIAHREAKPLLRDDLFRVLDAMGESTKDARDRALLPVVKRR